MIILTSFSGLRNPGYLRIVRVTAINLDLKICAFATLMNVVNVWEEAFSCNLIQSKAADPPTEIATCNIAIVHV